MPSFSSKLESARFSLLPPFRALIGLCLLSTVLAPLSCGTPKESIVVDGLSGPRGLAMSESGTVLIAEAGGGRILELVDGHRTHELAKGLPHTLDSGPGGNYPAGPAAVVELENKLYVVVGEFKGERFGRLYRVDPDGTHEAITGPTGINFEAAGRFSNPYDLIEAPEINGWIVADAGRNALLAVSSNGTTRDYALFPKLNVQGVETKVEVVPTGIDRGPDGAVYVGSFTGFPYPEGEAIVWRIDDENDDGDALDLGEVEPYLGGYTVITDISFDPEGRLYVAEFTSDMLKVIEGGKIAENANDYPGRVTLFDGKGKRLITDNVISPTGILILGDDLYVSEEFADRVRRITVE